MLIACKCLNLIASSNSSSCSHQQQQQQQQEKFEKNLIKSNNTAVTTGGTAASTASDNGSSGRFYMHGVNLDELQKQQKTNRIYSECLEFLRQAIGPIKDLTVTINQTDLIYKVPIESWYLHYCINCNTITHAKQISELDTTTTTTTTNYLINSTILTNNEEINSLKLSKSFSTTFGILMIDNQLLKSSPNNEEVLAINSTTTTKIQQFSNDNNIVNNYNSSNKKLKYNSRIKNLTEHLNIRLQKEILETDERIRRYTEQQFVLLKSYREKAEQEYQILVSLVNQVPETLKVIDAIDNNLTTITTKTKTPTTSTSSTKTTNSSTQQQQQQVSNLDTPPATPDSTPMSVGNSPTFRQQTTNSNIFPSSLSGGGIGSGGRSAINGTTNFVVGSGGATLDSDCLFELEGMENYPISVSNAMSDVEETEDAEDALGELDSIMQIPRSNLKKSSSLDIAKSLPISISAVAATQGRFNMEDIDDEIPEDSNIDIAASIKALAKSVHGDTVFGDLPRPRFSTQI